MGKGLGLAALLMVIGCTEQGTRPAVPATAKAPAETPQPAEEAPAPEPYDGPPKTVLVELYTSQGCNSCPEADAFLGTFPELGWDRDEVIPLTFHVTYWDDLGWQDQYARPLFDQRQIGYAQQLPGARADDETTIKGPYTPQMVVDGRVHFSGTLKKVATEEIGAAAQQPTLISIEPTASLADARVTVSVKSSAAQGAPFDTDRSKIGLFAALTQKTLTTAVPRGENAGKTLEEFWVVRDFAGPKLFRSSKPVNDTQFELAVPADVKPEQLDVVVFAQDLASMNIIASATAPAQPDQVAKAG